MSKQFMVDIKNLAYRFRDDDVLALAAQLAYSLILSFFPFVIFVMSMIGMSSIDSREVLFGLEKIIPSGAFQLIQNSVVEVLQIKSKHLMSLSFVVTIWTASSGFNAVIKGLNKAYDEEEHRTFLKLQFVSILCTLALGFVMTITILFLVFGEILGDSIAFSYGLSHEFKIGWNLFRYMVILVSMIYIFAALYHYTPSRRLNWQEVIPGAIFATVGWVIASLAFSYYVNNFGSYARIYGSIGTVIVLLTWLYLTSIIIIMGGQLNATLAFDREGKVKPVGKKY